MTNDKPREFWLIEEIDDNFFFALYASRLPNEGAKYHVIEYSAYQKKCDLLNKVYETAIAHTDALKRERDELKSVLEKYRGES